MIEVCSVCGEATGQAGAAEDSIFCSNEDCGLGPLCRHCTVFEDECWCIDCAGREITTLRATIEAKDAEITRLTADNAALREWALNALGWLEWEVDTDNTSEVLAAVRDGEELIKSGRLMLSSRAALDAKEV